jgi:hypothetical protein
MDIGYGDHTIIQFLNGLIASVYADTLYLLSMVGIYKISGHKDKGFFVQLLKSHR